MGNGFHRLSKSQPPQLHFFEDRRLLPRVRFWIAVNGVTLIYRFKFWRLNATLQGKGVGLARNDFKQYQLGRRFALGASAGYLASRYSLAPFGEFRDYCLHADLFGYWSSFLITADAAMDSKGLSRSRSRDLLKKCFDAFCQRSNSVPSHSAVKQSYDDVFYEAADRTRLPMIAEDSDLRFENFAIEMARRIGSTLEAIGDRHLLYGSQAKFISGLEQFYRLTLELITGQLSSLEQRVVDNEHDWGWYRNILYAKSMNVLLAPLCLFVSPLSEIDPATKLKSCFLLINRTFFHRQVLDDILDVQEDLSAGSANSLVYMIISQGRIAECATEGDLVSNKIAILREIKRSCMLASEFSLDFVLFKPNGSEIDSEEGFANCPNDTLPEIVKASLANRPADKMLPLPDLVALCSARKTQLIDAWAKEDLDGVGRLVNDSGIIARILVSIAERTDLDEVESALKSLGDDNVREVMNLFYVRTFRTYERCITECLRCERA